MRKVMIFLVATGIAILCALLLDAQEYKTFLDFFEVITCGFFIGNAGEHIASGIKRVGQ